MLDLDLRALIGRMNDITQRPVHNALGLAVTRTNYNVEIEHWLRALLEIDGSDLRQILVHFKVDGGTLLTELNQSLDKFKRGNTRAPALSAELQAMMRDGILLSTVESPALRVRSGHLIASVLNDSEIRRQVLSS